MTVDEALAQIHAAYCYRATQDGRVPFAMEVRTDIWKILESLAAEEFNKGYDDGAGRRSMQP